MCSNNGEILRDAAVRGLGIVLLPKFIVQKNLERWQLQEIRLDYQPQTLSLCVLYPINRQLSTKVQLITAFLQERLGTLFNA
ncbi:MAG: LysR substrate-binding domain-containing protein, partial [Cyanobacteria bacterium P01_F01_bin.116]